MVWQSIDGFVFNRDKTNLVVVQGILNLMRDHEEWVGTATDLLASLKDRASACYEMYLPPIPNKLSNVIKSNSAMLKKHGVEVFKKHSGSRTIKLIKTPQPEGVLNMKSDAKEKVIDALTIDSNNGATLRDITDLTGLTYDYVRVIIQRLRTKGNIEVVVGSKPTRYKHITAASNKAEEVAVYGPLDKIRFLTLAMGEVDSDQLTEILGFSEEDAPRLLVSAAGKYQDLELMVCLEVKRKVDNVGLYANKADLDDMGLRVWHLSMALKSCTLEDVVTILKLDKTLAKSTMIAVGDKCKQTVSYVCKLKTR